MKTRLFSLLILLTLAGALGAEKAVAKSPNAIYSKATGHAIRGPFLEFYLRIPNPQEIYGEPITDAFTDLDTHGLVQYFEKARFEYDPYAKDGNTIHLTPLGEILYETDRTKAAPAAYINNSANCRISLETNLRVCNAFLTYYLANGAGNTFGPPVSEAVTLDKYFVQYFTHARLIWNPALPPNGSIEVADLGVEYFYANKEDPARLEPQTGEGESVKAGVTELSAQASPHQGVTQREGRQTIYIHVSDQRGLPVAGAQTVVIVQMPDGEQARYIVTRLTNQDGFTQFSFPFSSAQVGLVQIQVEVSHQGLHAETNTSFHLWW